MYGSVANRVVHEIYRVKLLVHWYADETRKENSTYEKMIRLNYNYNQRPKYYIEKITKTIL